MCGNERRKFGEKNLDCCESARQRARNAGARRGEQGVAGYIGGLGCAVYTTRCSTKGL